MKGQPFRGATSNPLITALRPSRCNLLRKRKLSSNITGIGHRRWEKERDEMVGSIAAKRLQTIGLRREALHRFSPGPLGPGSCKIRGSSAESAQETKPEFWRGFTNLISQHRDPSVALDGYNSSALTALGTSYYEYLGLADSAQDFGELSRVAKIFPALRA
jgi:hypothetical protein